MTSPAPATLPRSTLLPATPPAGGEAEGLLPAENLLDRLLAGQQLLQTPVAQFAARHGSNSERSALFRHLIPLELPRPGEQYAFQVELDKCTGCKACVAACHSLNGLDDHEAWREVGTLAGGEAAPHSQQTVTTACHHCLDPECLHGCPVGAYHKDPQTGIVRHLDDQCIGCQYCIMKCPYEVPQYSRRRGIVRKCDMCHQRLAAEEAPACVQACPTEAIRIVTVRTSDPPAPSFLPGTPDPRITRPTTRFRGRPVPATAAPAGRDILHPQPAHLPLAVMLVLSQAGVGLFTAGMLAQTGLLSLTGTALFLAGLAASILHLGRPLGAWRFFLGLRRSWLSREILAFALAALAMPAAILLEGTPALAVALPSLLAAWGAILASVMVYADTKRPTWTFSRTSARFLGTAALATAFGLCTAGFLDAVVFASLLLLKLAAEAGTLLAATKREWSPLRHAARLQLCPLRRVLQARMVLGAGAVLLVPLWLPGAGLLFIAGELAERLLYFRSAANARMPGPAPAE